MAQDARDRVRLPSADACVARNLIDRHAAQQPDKLFAVFEDGTRWTYRDLAVQVRTYAAGLQALGVNQEDFVLSWLPNGPHAVAVMYALNYLGAVYVPINTSYRGTILAHVVANSGARLIVADDRLAGRLAEVDKALLKTVVLVGLGPVDLPGLEVLPEARLSADPDSLKDLPRPVAPWDTQTVVYTSGTTGPSKGVLSSYIQSHETMMALGHVMGPDDVNLASLPMFHVGGTGAVNGALIRGSTIVLAESFRTDAFWDIVRKHGVTSTVLLGAMTPFLLKRPPSPDDRDHSLRMATMVPLSEDGVAFKERFGTDIFTVFNMTEVSCPLISEANPSERGVAGRPRAGVEVRVVDENDCEVGPGELGELIVRTDMPWAMNHGYHRNPEATARAWRNGWFHTGDAFRTDAAGNFYFVDRMKDAIRRRGENISSFEVEAEIQAHPDVREAAVVATASEFGEDEVLAIVSPVPGKVIDPATLTAFLQPRLPHFMVPRYIRFLSDLPKTPTQKVQKHLLRSEGVTADTWDREKHGIRLKRERLDTRKIA
ncbi:AMP-binding protein [Zavarzinia sp. CC-PAN008]|uniref:AMP-binding protein n=1 Tax=Zavarzinia sp. CC-PAN008 TaxID=3243332 RepID=UPI003F7448C1